MAADRGRQRFGDLGQRIDVDQLTVTDRRAGVTRRP